MSVDRLKDLKKGQDYEERYELHSTPTTMDGFLNTITQLQDQVRSIHTHVDQIQTIQAAMLQVTDTESLILHRTELDTLTQATQTLMNHTKQQLKAIEPAMGQSDLTVRKNQFAALTRQFLASIERHRTTAVDFQRDEAKQLERQIKIANPDATADDIASAIARAEQGGSAVFSQQLLRHQTAQSTLTAVQERHDDIRRLAQSVHELSDLFQEMQSLLDHQAKVLGEIETTSYDVVDQIEQGEKHVATAILSAKATRRKKWICFGIFVIILIILAIVLAVKFAPSK
ncbi:hypothetical protein [Absidia glauca]|uniref:t-SNARE coiled-coil homology domain-containing protein n=1 Tax=Absidia glauca TaxID=4829 RepID=A0A168MBY4_ABSGL|nr:hypothetical protein [Absidia glauca]